MRDRLFSTRQVAFMTYTRGIIPGKTYAFKK